MAVEISVILPCRNEEKTIGRCIESIESVFKEHKIKGEIIVSDSSADKSPAIAKKYNINLVKHGKKGYGIACMEAFKHAKGKYIIIADSDGTYDFAEIPLFLDSLKSGSDLVIGTRLKGEIKPGAMPFLHRYIGNPVLSFLLNLFFGTKVSDTNSGFRGIKADIIKKLDLRTTGMEFASEMIIKAAKNHLRISEVPISYYPRIGKSKLKSFSDGWRHLRFMLLFSPTYLFLIPGAIFFLSGIFFLARLFAGNLSSLFAAIGALSTILGYEIINLGLYSRIYSIHTGFEKNDKLIDFIAEKIPLERGITIGFVIILASIAGFTFQVSRMSGQNNSGLMYYPLIMAAITAFTIGIQTIFSVFFISMMLIEKRD